MKLKKCNQPLTTNQLFGIFGTSLGLVKHARTIYISFLQTFGVFPLNFVPYVDGKFITTPPAKLVHETNIDVDIMIGVNKDEGAWVTTSEFCILL